MKCETWAAAARRAKGSDLPMHWPQFSIFSKNESEDGISSLATDTLHISWTDLREVSLVLWGHGISVCFTSNNIKHRVSSWIAKLSRGWHYRCKIARRVISIHFLAVLQWTQRELMIWGAERQALLWCSIFKQVTGNWPFSISSTVAAPVSHGLMDGKSHSSGDAIDFLLVQPKTADSR